MHFKITQPQHHGEMILRLVNINTAESRVRTPAASTNYFNNIIFLMDVNVPASTL